LKYTETDSEGEDDGKEGDQATLAGSPPGSESKVKDEGDSAAAASSQSQCGSKVKKDGVNKLTFANRYSEKHVSAALASLSPQSLKDVFYIGSRAVAQMILIHRGPDNVPSTPEEEEQMQQ
jgi:hypothetical protein